MHMNISALWGLLQQCGSSSTHNLKVEVLTQNGRCTCGWYAIVGYVCMYVCMYVCVFIYIHIFQKFHGFCKRTMVFETHLIANWNQFFFKDLETVVTCWITWLLSTDRFHCLRIGGLDHRRLMLVLVLSRFLGWMFLIIHGHVALRKLTHVNIENLSFKPAAWVVISWDFKLINSYARSIIVFKCDVLNVQLPPSVDRNHWLRVEIEKQQDLRLAQKKGDEHFIANQTPFCPLIL